VSAIRLQHVSLAVPPSRLADCVAFYRDGLGMEEVENLGGAAWLRFGDGDHVHLLTGPANPSEAHFALQVDDLGDALERVRSAGGDPQRQRPLWGEDRWYVRDPVGNLVELFALPPE
jgi:catechol 2,3-dioxygenase-like lactoylglutathione lyase family enzyme